jgi:hypothetical protein
MLSVDFGMLPNLAGPAGKEIYMKEALEQVVDLFRAPGSVGCCCSGTAKMPYCGSDMMPLR